MTIKLDQLHRYTFEDLHVRGELVQLEQTIDDIVSAHDYPDGVRQLLAELVTATCLLTATLKFEGEIAVQIQGDGPIGYLAVNGNNRQEMRGIARLTTPSQAKGLRDLVGNGNMVITIRPKSGEPYQGVVALEEDSVAGCIAHYFEVSEQIPTKIWLFNDANSNRVAGTLVQLLPDGDDKEKQLNDYEHLCQLTNTVKADEILTLDAQDMLYRLYHQENVRLFEAQAVSYQCSCSAEKCLDAISQIAPDELKSIIEEQGNVNMTCDYCMTHYAFDETQLAQFINQSPH